MEAQLPFSVEPSHFLTIHGSFRLEKKKKGHSDTEERPVHALM